MSTANTPSDLDYRVEKTLRALRIPGKMKGLRYLTYAISATVCDPTRTRLITKDLYHEIARSFDTTASCVERDIRSAIYICWQQTQAELERIAGHPLEKRPTNSEFIDLVAFVLRAK